MAQLDKTFPTGDCAICILAPKMVDVARHPNIKLLTYSEIKSIKGYVGNYDVTVFRKPRYVDETKCIGCGLCAEKCPTKVPNEFDMGLSERKAIYVQFPQAVPLKYTIDSANCIHFKKGKCGLCEKTCVNKAINYEQTGEELKFKAGTVIVATGSDPYVPQVRGVYGYREYKNVITALELERLINAAGPTMGHLMRPSDGKEPKKIAFIQCVGSRNWKIANKYCSRVCCMYTMKNAQIIKEHIPDAEISVYYIDIRAFGKGFEEFYHRIRVEYGVEYIRGRPAKVIENKATGNLIIRAEETLLNRITEREFDLMVLSIGLIPSKGSDELARLLNISRSPDGFFQEAHPKLRPVDTAMEGVFICGCAHSPKDIPDTVAQAKAAASSAAVLMSRGKMLIEPLTSFIDETKCLGCGLCAEICPYKAPQLVDGPAGARMQIVDALCRGCGACVASCPRQAIECRQYRNVQIEAEMCAGLSCHGAGSGIAGDSDTGGNASG
jgi:heterodisulfide reductase subunit A